MLKYIRQVHRGFIQHPRILKYTFYFACLPALLISSIASSAEQENFLFILDKNVDVRDFRTANDDYKLFINDLPSRKGLSSLNASGSTQFSEDGLRQIKHQIGRKNLIIIDLRRESHGFINGLPVSWVSSTGWSNQNKSASEIQVIEHELLRNTLNSKSLALAVILKEKGRKEIIPTPLFPKIIATEADLCQQEDVGYLRIPVEDHMKPNDHEVDRFIKFVQNLPEDSWLHFHCKGGSGRTTSFMIMYDMMKNAKDVSEEDIIRRQWLVGKTYLADFTKTSAYEHPQEFMERLDFIKEFYTYCRNNTDNYQTSWSSWTASKETRISALK